MTTDKPEKPRSRRIVQGLGTFFLGWSLAVSLVNATARDYPTVATVLMFLPLAFYAVAIPCMLVESVRMTRRMRAQEAEILQQIQDVGKLIKQREERFARDVTAAQSDRWVN